MQQLNLVDRRLLPPRHLLSGTRLLAAAAIAMALVATHLGIERGRMTQALAAAQLAPPGEAAADATPDDADHAMQTRIAQRQALRDMLARADRLPRDSAGLLQAVIHALPETVWLTEVDLRGAQGLRIAGGAQQPAALRIFADRLAAIELLRGVPIETLRIEPQADDGPADAASPAMHRFVLASAGYVALEDGR